MCKDYRAVYRATSEIIKHQTDIHVTNLERSVLHVNKCMVFRWGHLRSRASPFYARLSHENSKRVWNLDLLKNARLEIARVRGRGSEISPSLSHSRSLALALSHSRASRFLKPVNFRHVWGFHVKTSRFYFKINRRGSRSRVAPTEHYTLYIFVLYLYWNIFLFSNDVAMGVWMIEYNDMI